MSDEKLKENEETAGKEMGFWDHIEELRKRIILSAVGVVVGCIVAGIFINQLIEYVLLRPAIAVKLDLQNLKPFGQPFLYFKIIIIAGIIIAVPFILYQLWKFIAPGLYIKEKYWVRQITFFTSFCFFSGVAFSYFVMIPSMLSFAAVFGTSKIKNIIDINEYFSFITTLLLASGIMFEMPMISFVLSKVGILKPQFLTKFRRHSIVIILIIAAVMTPSTDPVSQLIFAVPLFVLYEISIFISKIANKKKNSAEENV